jgi:hypothetical protein
MLQPIKQESPELIAAWQKIADHTGQKCGLPHCGILYRENRCCDKLYCKIAEDYARDRFGIVLPKTDHPTLQFMGEKGCTVAPYLRPLCSLHQCGICSMGVLKGDPAWTVEYFRLREAIDILEEARQPS